MAFAFSLLLLMFLHADNRFGLGRWWEAHTQSLLHETVRHDQTATNLRGRNSQILTVAWCTKARYRSAREANHHPTRR
jgi:hypothetical protein